MSEPSDPSPAERWFKLATEDLDAGRVLVGDGSAALRIAGFLAQQAAAKALKAGLFASMIDVPTGFASSTVCCPTSPTRRAPTTTSTCSTRG